MFNPPTIPAVLIGNGSATQLAYTWPIRFASDITVTQTDTSGNVTTLVNSVNYTVAGLNDPNSADWVITLTTPAITNYVIKAFPSVPGGQSDNISTQGGALPETIESALDRAWVAIGQLTYSIYLTQTQVAAGGVLSVNTMTGAVVLTAASFGAPTLSGTQTFSGNNTFSGNTTHSGNDVFNGTISGTGLTTYFAIPPAIGGTTPAAATFTNLKVNTTQSYAVTTLTPAATVTIDCSLNNVFTLIPNQATSIAAANVPSGSSTYKEITFIIVTSGTTSYTLTQVSSVIMNGTLSTGTANGKTWTIKYAAINGVLYELSRSGPL